MEYWEDRNCSKRYNEIVDATHEVFLKMESGDATLEEYQEALLLEEGLLNTLNPEDFGLSNGDYFVDVAYGVRLRLLKIEDDVLYEHSVNDVWHNTNNQPGNNLASAMSLTRKGKWLRFREAPLGA